MTERQKFIKSEELIVIHDSDYKSTRKSKINFEANYLQFKDEIKIMVGRNIKIYSRNFKSIFFIFASPLVMMILLQLIQILSDNFSSTQITKDPPLTNLTQIDINCKNSKFFAHNFIKNTKNEIINDCISVGISILGKANEFESQKINFVMQAIANNTNLIIEKDIVKISSGFNLWENNNKDIQNTASDDQSINNIYNILETNPGKIQYLVVFCLTEIDLGIGKIPCKPQFEISKDNINFDDKIKENGMKNIPFKDKFDFYTILYNITNTLNGFLDKFNTPLPTDNSLTKLKILVDNSLLKFYSKIKMEKEKVVNQSIPSIGDIFTTFFPLPLSRFARNADVISLFGVFYLFFPSMILFSLVLIDLVKEKESNLKNYLHLNGLSVFSYWTSWIITSIMASILLACEIVILGKLIFKFDLFVNSNILISFSLFFFFTLTMQFFAFLISGMINSLSSATTISYGIILIGFVNQCIFTNYGITYFFYAVNLNSVFLIIIRYLLHLYPPFLFTKCYLDISRRATFHFDGPSLSWKSGEYFGLDDIFSSLEGELRIGAIYKIESFFKSTLWFIFLMMISVIIIAYNELRENMKLGEKSGYFLYEIYITFKTAINLFRLKNINIKRERLENEVNKIYEKFTKNYHLNEKAKIINNSLIKNTNSLEVHDCDISVIHEKLLIGEHCKKRTIPQGIRILCESKIYNKKHIALEDINLEINKGELITILGSNGSGKSTLINILIGQIGCSFGHAKVGPFIIHHELIVDSYYVKRLLGVCSQADSFWDELTVYETMFLFSRLRGIKEERINEYIDQKILEVNLINKKDEKVGNLSGGMKRRLSICISLLGDPTVILMDEPTTGLDPINKKKIWKLINTIKKNRVVILTTHLMEEADYLSDRIAVIMNGKLRFIGNSTEMRELYNNGIILQLHVDVSRLKDKKDYFDNDLTFLFFGSKIEVSKSGIYSVIISKNNKEHIIMAFEIFNRKSKNEKIGKLIEYIKESSISQSNLENVFLELCKKYQ